MDFDDHDDQEEEIGLPVESSYESPSGNSSRGGPSGAVLGKISGGGGDAGAASSAAMAAGPGGSWKAAAGSGRYRECLKNHAVGIGGHAVDGCGEFMAAGEEGTLDALMCAACNCHRNFHRKEVEGGGGGGGGAGGMVGMEGPGGFHHHFSPYYRIPAGYLQHHHAGAHIRPSPLPLALPSTSGGGGAHSRDDQEDMSNPMAGGGGGAFSGGREGKKRFRTKFTQEQKDKMLAFAEKLGWRIQKHDEAAVQQFCAETCIKRHVLKVWMHNNKHTLGNTSKPMSQISHGSGSHGNAFRRLGGEAWD